MRVDTDNTDNEVKDQVSNLKKKQSLIDMTQLILGWAIWGGIVAATADSARDLANHDGASIYTAHSHTLGHAIPAAVSLIVIEGMLDLYVAYQNKEDKDRKAKLAEATSRTVLGAATILAYFKVLGPLTASCTAVAAACPFAVPVLFFAINAGLFIRECSSLIRLNKEIDQLSRDITDSEAELKSVQEAKADDPVLKGQSKEEKIAEVTATITQKKRERKALQAERTGTIKAMSWIAVAATVGFVTTVVALTCFPPTSIIFLSLMLASIAIYVASNRAIYLAKTTAQKEANEARKEAKDEKEDRPVANPSFWSKLNPFKCCIPSEQPVTSSTSTLSV